MSWLIGENTRPVEVSPSLLKHLMLDELLGTYIESPERMLTADADEIGNRGRIIRDLTANNELYNAFNELYETLTVACDLRSMPEIDAQRTLSCISAVRDVTSAFEKVSNAVKSGGELRSDAFARTAQRLEEFLVKLLPLNFTDAWESAASSVDFTGSTTYRISFNSDLEADGFSLIAVKRERYTKQSLLDFLKPCAPMQFRRVTPLTKQSGNIGMRYDPTRERNVAQLLMAAAGELSRLQTVEIRRMLRGFSVMLEQNLGGLRRELGFVLGLVKISNACFANRECAFAQICPSGEHAMEVQDAYHPYLAKKLAQEGGQPVKCGISFSRDGALQIVSGANGGGKTTYLRTVGAIQVLFQLGLPLPCSAASISPADSIVCAFTSDEQKGHEAGKLGAELAALGEAVRSLTPNGVFLCNEPVTGTSARECAAICAQVLASLKVNGQRGVWVTHLYPLVELALRMNDALPGGKIASLYAGAKGYAKYTLRSGAPDKNSHAKKQYAEIVQRIVS